MDNHTLERLERQVDAILQEYGRQKKRSTELRNKQATLMAERNELYEKLKIAVSGVKKVVKRLKTIEREYVHDRS